MTTPSYTPGEGHVGPWKLVAFPYGGGQWRILRERERWDWREEGYELETRPSDDWTVYDSEESANAAIAKMLPV